MLQIISNRCKDETCRFKDGLSSLSLIFACQRVIHISSGRAINFLNNWYTFTLFCVVQATFRWAGITHCLAKVLWTGQTKNCILSVGQCVRHSSVSCPPPQSWWPQDTLQINYRYSPLPDKLSAEDRSFLTELVTKDHPYSINFLAFPFTAFL